MNAKNALKLIAAIILCEILGSVGAIFTIPNIQTWYAALAKPFFAPPNWLFGPAWTILFALMGIALYLIWESKEKKNKIKRKTALNWFAIQFAFNILWSFLFFGLRSPFLGLVGIIFLWVSIALTIMSFHKVSKQSAYLLIPYILWVSFAGILNAAVWMLNP